jgi:class 3 adenylate cyclase
MEGRRERKVVTVLFADLVGFTARAEQLDPEDARALAFYRMVGATRYVREGEALLAASA